MAQHFEELWEEAENLAYDMSDLDVIKASGKITELLMTIVSDKSKVDAVGHSYNEHPEIAELVGELLLNLCFLSKELNVNVFAALKSAMNEKKVDHYG